MSFFKNYLTTIPGVLALLNAAWKFYTTRELSQTDVDMVLIAFGLIAAKDANKTGV